MLNDPDDSKNQEMLEKSLQYARNEAREERNWKVILPEMIAFAGLYTWTTINFPAVLQVTAAGLAYFFVVYAIMAAIRVGLGYPVAYLTAYFLLMQGREVSADVSIMVNAIESWLMWPLALIVVAALSPDNASYASALTLFSGALALGIFKGILRLVFGNSNPDRSDNSR
jgi:hypothetical protein